MRDCIADRLRDNVIAEDDLIKELAELVDNELWLFLDWLREKPELLSLLPSSPRPPEPDEDDLAEEPVTTDLEHEFYAVLASYRRGDNPDATWSALKAGYWDEHYPLAPWGDHRVSHYCSLSIEFSTD